MWLSTDSTQRFLWPQGANDLPAERPGIVTEFSVTEVACPDGRLCLKRSLVWSAAAIPEGLLRLTPRGCRALLLQRPPGQHLCPTTWMTCLPAPETLASSLPTSSSARGEAACVGMPHLPPARVWLDPVLGCGHLRSSSHLCSCRASLSHFAFALSSVSPPALLHCYFSVFPFLCLLSLLFCSSSCLLYSSLSLLLSLVFIIIGLSPSLLLPTPGAILTSSSFPELNTFSSEAWATCRTQDLDL